MRLFIVFFLSFLLMDFSMLEPVPVSEKDDLTISCPSPNCTARRAHVVTEEWVQSIINSKDEDLELVDFSVSPGSEIGDHFSSNMYSVRINVKSNTTGKFTSINVMLKMMQQGLSPQKDDWNLRNFKNEASMYSRVLPDFVKFQQDQGLKEDEIFKAYPNYYKAHVNNRNIDYIAIEDLRPLGFKMANQLNGLDLLHCEIALRTLARFHAVSFAMFGGDYDRVQEQYPFLQELTYLKQQDIDENSTRKIPYKFQAQVAELRHGGFEAEAALIETVYDDRFLDQMRKLTAERVPNAVLVHGDFWWSNVMFAYDQESGKAKEARFVDFQVSRISSRALDLSYFMYTSAQIKLLNEQEVQLLRIYHDEFTYFCTKLGYINQKLTFQALVDEYQYVCPYGISGAVLIASLQLGKEMDKVNLFAHSNDTKKNYANYSKNYSIWNSAIKNPRALERLKDIASNHILKCPNEWTKTMTAAKMGPAFQAFTFHS